MEDDVTVLAKPVSRTISSSSLKEDIANFALLFLGRIASNSRRNDEDCVFENFPEVIVTILRFALLQSKGSSMLDKALSCATAFCTNIDMTKQPALPTEFFSVVGQLLEKKFEDHETVLRIIDGSCVTPESKSLAVQELKRISSKLRAASHRIMQSFMKVASDILSPCVSFYQAREKNGGGGLS